MSEISKNDIIFLEALKSDGIIIDKKYDDLYKVDLSEIPTDIQVMINNEEKAATLLRIAEVVGQDSLDRMDEDTMYFMSRNKTPMVNNPPFLENILAAKAQGNFGI